MNRFRMFGQIVRKTQIAVCLLVFLVFLLPTVGLGSETVGVLSFVDKRPQQQASWLGFYIQARIVSLLRKNTNWNFHSDSTIRLWRLKSGSVTSKPNEDSTLLISGSAQQVVDYGSISVKAIRPGEKPLPLGESTLDFHMETLDRSIDSLAMRIGGWVSPGFSLVETDVSPSWGEAKTEQCFRLRQQLEDPQALPDTALVLDLLDTVSDATPTETVAVLAESMTILSQTMEGNDQRYLLRKSETMLRQSLLKHQESARLLALFAEVLYLAQEERSLVGKLASDALKIDPQSDLAALMLALSSGLDSQPGREAIARVRKINPWLWPESKNDPVRFQKGILTERLLQ